MILNNEVHFDSPSAVQGLSEPTPTRPRGSAPRHHDPAAPEAARHHDPAAKPDACHHNFVEPEAATNEGMSTRDAFQERAL